MKNFIVYRSSAGSGKTYNLAVNYISLALGKNTFYKSYFRKILAITFTNKAAKEMKERILHYLFNLSISKDIDSVLKEIKFKTGLSKEVIFERSSKLYSYIIHNYSDLSIQTIDKFTYKIVKSFSRELAINSDFELELDSTKIIQPVVESILEKVSDENKTFSDILVDFTIQKITDGNNYNIHKDLEDFSKHFFIEGSENKLLESNISINQTKKIKDELFSKRNFQMKKIHSLQNEVVHYFSKKNLTEQHFIRGTYYNFFTKKLLSENYRDWIPTESFKRNIENNIWYKNSLEESQKLKIDNCKLDLIKYYDEFITILKDYLTINSVLNNIYPSIIINELFSEINNFKKENNIEHLSSFNRKIHDIVTSQVSSFIFERLGERYNHFLIDEFQDTSVLQWQNFLPLLADTLDFGKSIIVGDGKQSIYRWRSGEVEQFLNLPQIYKGAGLSYFSEWQAKLINHYKSENLSENFRSKKNIIEFNNNFFSEAKNILSDELIEIYKNHKQDFTYAEDGGYININLFDKEVFNKEMLKYILAEVNDLVQNYMYSFKDMAILCNTNKEIEKIADYLSINNIPFVSNEGLLISKSLKVKLIVSVLKYLQNNDDDLIKVSVLAKLHKIHAFKISSHQLFLKVKQEISLVEILNELGFNLNTNKILQKSLLEIVYDITDSLKITKDIFVDFFLDTVHSYTQKKLSNISAFLDYWSEISQTKSITISEEINAVNLMTIHKSKGLAFPVVFIPFNWISSPKKEMWVKNDSKISEQLPYSLISQNKNLSLSYYASQYNKEKDLTVLDNLNKLYVACTRAKDVLYIFSERSEKKSLNNFNINSLTSNYIKKEPFVQGSKAVKKSLSSKSKKIINKQEILVNDWEDRLTLKNSSVDFWDNENPQEKKDWGKLLHFVLSKIYSLEEKDKIIEDIYLRGICNKTEYDKLIFEINTLFECPEILFFFNKEWQVKTEKEILLPNGKTYIPDRLLFKENEVIVIDYKTGKKDKSHHQQIVKYSNALKNMGYKNISLYLIYTSQKNKVEKI